MVADPLAPPGPRRRGATAWRRGVSRGRSVYGKQARDGGSASCPRAGLDTNVLDLFRSPWESVVPDEGNLRYVPRRIDVYDDPRSRTLPRPAAG